MPHGVATQESNLLFPFSAGRPHLEGLIAGKKLVFGVQRVTTQGVEP
jgi:hypothetical protein